MSQCQPGPNSIQELGQWDKTYAAVYKEHGLAARVVDNTKAGLLLYGDFSGYEAARECFRIFLPAVCAACNAPTPRWAWARSSDCDQLPQETLAWISVNLEGGRMCVFGDIDGCLDGDAKALVESILEDDSEAGAAERNVAIEDYL